jgi:hypothetical protein
MAKDEKKAKGHKARFFCKLFRAQKKAKLDDEQLAKLAEKEYPNSRDWLKSMPALRAHFNRGGFTAVQDGAPSRPVPQYVKGEAVKVKLGRPAATKTKSKPKAKTKPKAKAKTKTKTKTTAKKKSKPAAKKKSAPKTKKKSKPKTKKKVTVKKKTKVKLGPAPVDEAA